jgi:hypothetical protein
VDHQIAVSIQRRVNELMVDQDVADFATDDPAQEGIMVAGAIVDRMSMLCLTEQSPNDVCVLLPKLLLTPSDPGVDNVPHKIELFRVVGMEKRLKLSYVAGNTP